PTSGPRSRPRGSARGRRWTAVPGGREPQPSRRTSWPPLTLPLASMPPSGGGEHRRVEAHRRELLRERLRRILEDLTRVVEGRLEVVRVLDPRRDEDERGDGQTLLQGVLDDPRVCLVRLDRVGEELDPEADVAGLVAVDGGEAGREAGEPAALTHRL